MFLSKFWQVDFHGVLGLNNMTKKHSLVFKEKQDKSGLCLFSCLNINNTEIIWREQMSEHP